MGARKHPMMTGFQAEENLTGRPPKKCAKNSGRYPAEYSDVKAIIDNYMDYYNDKRSQWRLAKLTPNEFYKFVTTGSYPLDIPNAPAVPSIKKPASGPEEAEPTDSADKK